MIQRSKICRMRSQISVCIILTVCVIPNLSLIQIIAFVKAHQTSKLKNFITEYMANIVLYSFFDIIINHGTTANHNCHMLFRLSRSKPTDVLSTGPEFLLNYLFVIAGIRAFGCDFITVHNILHLVPCHVRFFPGTPKRT